MKDSRFRYEDSINKCFGVFRWDDADSTLDVGYNTENHTKNKSCIEDNKNTLYFIEEFLFIFFFFTNAGPQWALLSAGYHGWSRSWACPRWFGPPWSCTEASRTAEDPRSDWPGLEDDCPLWKSPLLSEEQKEAISYIACAVIKMVTGKTDKSQIKIRKVWQITQIICSNAKKQKTTQKPAALWSLLVCKLQRALISLSMHCQKGAYLCSHISNTLSGRKL